MAARSDYGEVNRVIETTILTSGRARGLALAALLAVTLVACGDEAPMSDADQPAVDQISTEVSIEDDDISPEAEDDAPAVDAPEDITTVTLTIADGAIDPSTVQVMTGEAFSLEVTNDGAGHEFGIPDIDDPTALTGNGETTIDFTAPTEPGEHPITLDGETVGTLEVQDAAGID